MKEVPWWPQSWVVGRAEGSNREELPQPLRLKEKKEGTVTKTYRLPQKKSHSVGAVAFRVEMHLLQTWGLNGRETVGPWISLFSKTLVFWLHLISFQLSQNPYLTHCQENVVILTLSHSPWWENRLVSGCGGANRDCTVQYLFSYITIYVDQ